MGLYWKPVYCYLRHKGYDNETAKDLTQSFFDDVVLRRHLIEQADPRRGRFRTFLLTALNRYVSNVHRDAVAKKRMPKSRLLSLDVSGLPDIPDAGRHTAPAAAFHYTWISELLDRVLANVEQECRADGLGVHWEVFKARVVQPVLGGADPPSLSELCARHGIEKPTTAANMMVTIKRRLRRTLEICVRESVGGDVDVEQEIRDLQVFLSEERTS
ncbi:MAG: hypothetical protein WBF17_00550 [Phycisphaerae bacterium]